MSVTLGELKAGAKGTIQALTQEGRAYRRKLLAMGLIPGTHFTVARIAPLGDPIQLEIRGYQLSLRRHEAAVVRVAVQ